MTAPSVNITDVDRFEARLTAWIATAPPDALRAAVHRASRFVEDRAEEGTAGQHITEINNATSTFGTVTRQLIKRLREAEQEIKRLKEGK